jgi:hypothetical protein
MSIRARFIEALACDQCRRYRQGILMIIALLTATWLLM